jgi:hypothetical protein
MKTITWNQASELGLIVRINREILHPLGLAMSRNPETGSSEYLMVSDDGVWEYSPLVLQNTPELSRDEIIERVATMDTV